MGSSVGVAIQALPLARIGESDCEALGGGRLAQPINALTSAAYIVVALLIAAAAVRRDVDRPRSFVYAGCVAFVGIGSILFHGPQPSVSRELHDLPILLTAAFIVVIDLELLVRRPRRGMLVFAVVAAALTATTFVSVALVAPLTGAMLATLAVLEFLIVRRRLRPIDSPTQARAYVVIIGVAVLAAAAWLLGRTGSPVCDPEGPLQLHGLWHILSSLIFGLWWWLAFWLPSAPTGSSATSPSPSVRPGVDAR